LTIPLKFGMQRKEISYLVLMLTIIMSVLLIFLLMKIRYSLHLMTTLQNVGVQKMAIYYIQFFARTVLAILL